MKIAIGSDHAGYEMKEAVKKILESGGHEVTDFGTHSKESVDYSDFGLSVARAVADHTVERGVAICWTGNGMMIAVNKVKGIRGTLCLNKDMAHLARAHNNSNVLVLAQKYVDMNDLQGIVDEWLKVEFEGGRHERRLEKIKNAES